MNRIWRIVTAGLMMIAIVMGHFAVTSYAGEEAGGEIQEISVSQNAVSDTEDIPDTDDGQEAESEEPDKTEEKEETEEIEETEETGMPTEKENEAVSEGDPAISQEEGEKESRTEEPQAGEEKQETVTEPEPEEENDKVQTETDTGEETDKDQTEAEGSAGTDKYEVRNVTGAEEILLSRGPMEAVESTAYDTEPVSFAEYWKIGFRGTNAVSEAYSEALYNDNVYACLYYRNGTDTEEGYTLAITGSGSMAGWESLEYVPWKDYAPEIYQVDVADGITRIGMNAFAGTGIRTVDLPQSITMIDSYAFAGSEVISADLSGLSEGVNLGSGLFQYCQSLASVILPESFTTSTTLYFDDGTNSNVILPATIFEGCTSLTSIDIPESVRAVGYRAAYGCTALIEITGAENVSFLPMAGSTAGAFYADCEEPLETIIADTASDEFMAYCFLEDNRIPVRNFSYTITMPAYVNAVYDTDHQLFNADIHARIRWTSRDAGVHRVTITSPEGFELIHTDNPSKTISFKEKEGNLRSFATGSWGTEATNTADNTFSYQSETGEYDPGNYQGNATFCFTTSE